MTRYIKDDSGKFAGSIGDGATNVPTAAPDIFLPPTENPSEDSSQSINQAYASFTRRQENPFVPEFSDPETTDAVLKRIDKIGERYSKRLDDLSERQYDIKTGRSFLIVNKHFVLEGLRKEEEKLRDAAIVAHEHLEAAKAIMEDRDPEIIPYKRYATLHADDVSYVASELRDVFGEQELQDDWDRGDVTVLDKVGRASRHILKAKRVLNAAIVPDKREPEDEEELDEE